MGGCGAGGKGWRGVEGFGRAKDCLHLRVCLLLVAPLRCPSRLRGKSPIDKLGTSRGQAKDTLGTGWGQAGDKLGTS